MTKQCKYCGKDFDASKDSALYCSNSCRTRANNVRRETERINNEKAQKQAKIEEAKRDEKEARRLKRAKKQADSAAVERLAAEEREIQAEINAWELNEKKRGINSIVGMLLVNAVAVEKQLQVDIELKTIEDKIKHDNKMRVARERGEILGKLLVGFIIYLSNDNNGPQQSTMKPEPMTKPGNFPTIGTTLPPLNPNSFNRSLAPNDFRPPGAMGGTGTSNKSIVSSPTVKILPNPPKSEPSQNVFDHILDLTKIF
jgi:hypothetical protein